ncbi:MAG: TetR/AcrR family transcriptional regulator [Nitrososphaerales archaeon]
MQDQEHRAKAERILLTASKLFAERGFANVSVRDICRETGTSAPVLYYYFGNKKGLFDAVARKQISMNDLIAKLSDVSEARDPKKALAAFVSVYLSSFPEHVFDPGLYLRDTATLDKHSAQMASEDLEKIRKMASALVERAVAAGDFRKVDVEFASDCLLGMLNRVIFQHIHFSKVSDREAYRRFVTDFFFRAMK